MGGVAHDDDTWVAGVAERLPGANLEFCFGPDVAVYKVAGRVFAFFIPPGHPSSVTVKAHPVDVDALVAAHDSVRRGYHMNKRHWVTVTRGGDVPDDFAAELVVQSWRLVVAALAAAQRSALFAELEARI